MDVIIIPLEDEENAENKGRNCLKKLGEVRLRVGISQHLDGSVPVLYFYFLHLVKMAVC